MRCGLGPNFTAYSRLVTSIGWSASSLPPPLRSLPSAAGPPRRALASLLSVDARRLRPQPTALRPESTALRPKLTTAAAASTLTAAECAALPQREAELRGAELPGAAVRGAELTVVAQQEQAAPLVAQTAQW